MCYSNLAPEHEEPTLSLATACSLAACQLSGIVSTHSEHAASGQHSGQGEKAR